MCPACFTTIALMAAAAVSAGGWTAVVMRGKSAAAGDGGQDPEQKIDAEQNG
jgi:hypothetical protein